MAFLYRVSTSPFIVLCGVMRKSPGWWPLVSITYSNRLLGSYPLGFFSLVSFLWRPPVLLRCCLPRIHPLVMSTKFRYRWTCGKAGLVGACRVYHSGLEAKRWLSIGSGSCRTRARCRAWIRS